MSDIFIKGTRNGNPYVAKYSGLNQATVNALVADLGVSNIQTATEQEFKDAMSEKPKTQEQIDAEQEKVSAVVDLKSKAKTADERLDALIKVLGL